MCSLESVLGESLLGELSTVLAAAQSNPRERVGLCAVEFRAGGLQRGQEYTTRVCVDHILLCHYMRKSRRRIIWTKQDWLDSRERERGGAYG